MLVALVLCGLGTTWGAEVTFGPSAFSGQGTSGTGSEISATIDGVTFACDKGYGTTQIRCYASSTITISSSNTITSISFTFDGSYTGGLNKTGYTGLSTTSWVQKLGSQARITEVKVTYTPATPAYTITAQSNNESFGTVSLTGNVITGAPNSGYRYASPAYTVSPANSATVAQDGNAFTVTPSANTTVTINFEAIPTYTVTYSDGGSVTETLGGQGVTLATREAIGSYTFAGWSTTNVSEETTTIPTIISTTSTYYPTSDIILYPVYTKTEETTAIEEKTANVTISDYATANNWGSSSSTNQKSIIINGDITATCNSGTNSGKYYSDWRIYQNETGKVTIATTNGTLKSVAFTFTVSNSGTLNYNSSKINSGTAVPVSGTSAEFTVGNSGTATNGQVRITAISVSYQTSGTSTTYYWSSPVEATVERPVISAPTTFFRNTEVSITCETEGASIYYSFDNSSWNEYTEPLTIAATSTIYAKAVKDSKESTVAEFTSTRVKRRLDVSIPNLNELNYDLAGKINVNAGPLIAKFTYEGEEVEGVPHTWISLDTNIAEVDQDGNLTLKAMGKTRISLSVQLNDDYSENGIAPEITVYDSYAKGGEHNPYTVAEALAATPSTGTYVTGVISQIDEVSTQYGNATYWISDNGETTTQLKVYRGKGLDNNSIEAEDEIQLGDIVVITGELKEYSGANQLAQGNYIVSLTRPEPIELAAPIIFHDGGTYEQALKVAMAGQGTIKYKLNGGAEQTYSAPIDVNETTTITAWVEQDGSKSDEISKTFTIEAKEAGPKIDDGYYTIKNNGNGKYVNVAGRRTVTFVDEAATAAAPGTVIKVKATDGQLEVLRSQGVDIPAYAEKAMNYVPQIVQLVVDKLHIEGSGELLGENGLKALMKKFDESFDYHLYLEKAGDYYRIYGRTPSMQPVVDFYAENKDNVDAKLPGLEEFINSAIQKILNKTNGSGASILVPFSLETIWEDMGGTLTNPAENQAKFYEEVLSSETNVWNFAYQTAMLYWGNLKDHPRYDEIKNNLGDLAKYIDKIENIQPNSKYYIVQQNGQMDIINQSNSVFISDIAAEADFTAWTLKERSEFQVTFPEANKLNNKYYTTLYTDFAYTLPETVKAYKVTDIEESGCYGYAVTEEVGSQNIAAQTPVLLVSETAEPQELTLAETGTAVTGNLLVGPDYLINTYTITAAQVESLFDMAKALLGEEGYNNYVKEYEHLMLRTAGTVNNKYFYGLSKDDCKLVDENVCVLDNSEEAGTGFATGWQTLNANNAFLTSDIYTAIRLSKVGDINRDGSITVADVTALVNVILGKAKYPDDAENYDFGATDVNCDGKTIITDVTTLVNIILGQ